MSANTLFGKLYSAASVEYEKTASALKENTALVNRFGDAMAQFSLTPHVRAGEHGGVSLSARTERGYKIDALFAALAIQGYHIGTAIKTPYQFNDGYEMWVVAITSNKLQFSLLYYTTVEAGA